MSDKVIRHYSRPYGDCRADKRLYFGGSWPWQQGAECEIPVPSGGPYYVEIPAHTPGTYYMWVQTGVSAREIVHSWEVPDDVDPWTIEITPYFSLSTMSVLPGVSRTLMFSQATVGTYLQEDPLTSQATYGFDGTYSLSTLTGFPPDPAFYDGYVFGDMFGGFTIDDYTVSSGTIQVAYHFES